MFVISHHLQDIRKKLLKLQTFELEMKVKVKEEKNGTPLSHSIRNVRLHVGDFFGI